jgi:hypothetical protein
MSGTTTDTTTATMKVCCGPLHKGGPDRSARGRSGTALPIDDFGVCSSSKGGRQGYCRACNREQRRLYRKDEPEVLRETRRRWAGNRRMAELAGRYARRMVKLGVLPKPAHCEHPGCTRTDIEFHHTEGYSRDKWLVGAWLCPEHHGTQHVGIKRPNRYKRAAAEDVGTPSRADTIPIRLRGETNEPREAHGQPVPQAEAAA